MRSPYWRQVAILVLAGIVGTAAVIPYQLALLPAALALPLPVLLLNALISGVILVTFCAAVGLWAARRVGLRAPVSESLATGGDLRAAIIALRPRSTVVVSLIATAVVIAIDVALFSPLVGELAAVSGKPARWQGVLASLYGGITEELLTRLFAVSVLAWVIGLVWRGHDGRPARGAFAIAIVCAALLFGAGHLPAAARLVPLTPPLVIRTVLLNGVLGTVFGWLYWRRGLEAAMLGHLSADLVLHGIVGG